MATPHEILFQLQAIQDKTFPKTFVDATNKVSTLQNQMQKLNNVDLSVMDKANQKVAQSKAQVDYLSNALDKSHRKTLELKRAYVQNTQSCTDMATAIKNCEAPSKNMINDFNKLTKEGNKLKNSWLKARTESINLKDQLNKQSTALRHVTDEAKALERAEISQAASNERLARLADKQLLMQERKLQSQERKLQGFKNLTKNIKQSTDGLIMNLAKARAQFMTIGSAFSPYAHMIEKSLEVEAMGAQIRKNIHFHDQQEYQKFTQNMLSIGKNYAISQKDILHVTEMASGAAFAKEELYGMTLAATKLGLATKTSFEEAAQINIDLRAGYGLTQEEVNKLNDAVVTLSDNSTNSAAFILKLLGQAGQQAKQIGMAPEILAAYGSALTNIQPEKAATGMMAFLSVLVKGEKVSKEQAVVFSRMGINLKELQNLMKTDTVAAINMVVEGLNKIPEAERAAASATIATTTGAPILAQLYNRKDDINKQIGIIKSGSYLGRVDKEAQIVNDSTINKIQLMKNTLDSLQLTIADTLLPTLADLATKAQEFFTWLQPIIEKHKELFKWVVILGVGFSAAIAIISGLGFVFLGIRGLITTIKAIAAAQAFWNAVSLANPMTWIILACIAASIILGYAINKLIENWDDVWAAVKRFGSSLDDLLEKFSPLYKMGKELGKAFGWLGDDKDVNVTVQKRDIDAEIKATQQANKPPVNQTLVYNNNQQIDLQSMTDPKHLQQLLKQSGTELPKDVMAKFKDLRFAN